MRNAAFMVGDTIATAWHKVHGAKATIWAAILIFFVISLIGNLLCAFLHAFIPPLGNIAAIISQVIYFLLGLGLYNIGIQRAASNRISYRQLYVRTFQTKTAIMLIGVFLLQTLILLLPALIAGIGITLYT